MVKRFTHQGSDSKASMMEVRPACPGSGSQMRQAYEPEGS